MLKRMDQKLFPSQMEMINVHFQLVLDGFLIRDDTSSWNPCPREI